MVRMSTLLSLLFCVKKTSNGRKVYITISFVLWIKKSSNGRKVYIAISFVLCEDIQWYRKDYIAITFVLWKEDIQWQERLHCYHFCIVEKRHSMVGKTTLLSLLYCGKKTSNGRKIYMLSLLYRGKSTSSGSVYNGRKVYIAITFVFYKEVIHW